MIKAICGYCKALKTRKALCNKELTQQAAACTVQTHTFPRSLGLDFGLLLGDGPLSLWNILPVRVFLSAWSLGPHQIVYANNVIMVKTVSVGLRLWATLLSVWPLECGVCMPMWLTPGHQGSVIFPSYELPLLVTRHMCCHILLLGELSTFCDSTVWEQLEACPGFSWTPSYVPFPLLISVCIVLL